MNKEHFRVGQSIAIKGIVRDVNTHPIGGVYVDVVTSSGDGLMLSINGVDVLDLDDLVPPKEKDPVVIPQHVADWISYHKFTGSSLLRAIELKEPGMYTSIEQKAIDQIKSFLGGERNIELFVHAWLYGYKVEEEKLYWVRNSEGKSLLYRNDAGRVTTSGGHSPLTQEDSRFNYTFTEKEIKAYDERYWVFATPVEEVNYNEIFM